MENVGHLGSVSVVIFSSHCFGKKTIVFPSHCVLRLSSLEYFCDVSFQKGKTPAVLGIQ